MYFKPNFVSGKYNITGNSELLIKIPVDHENGDIHLYDTFIGNNFHIPEGIYPCKNYHILAPVRNRSYLDQIFFIEQPLKVTSLTENFNTIEFNNHQIVNKYSTENQTKFGNLIRTNHLNVEEKQKLLKLLSKFNHLFQLENQQLSFTNQIKHEIRTKDDLPVYTKSYRYPHIHKEEVQKQISKMLDQGIIRPSYSPWSSPIWIVPKKLDASNIKKWRLVVDYRKLNEKTIDDRYPLPNITDILDKLGKCIYFSTLDLASGFHQIEVNPKDIQKTAFTVEQGHYEYVRMPFGLKGAPSTFQRVMDNILRDLIGKICFVYMDDIIIFSTSLQEHLENLERVLNKLNEANFKIQIDKSEFLKKEINFLGHVVTDKGIKPNPDKIKAIINYPIPKTTKQIKGFLGLVGYYRKFIPDFAKLTKPLTKCLKKNSIIKLDSEYLKCVNDCKHILTHDPILQYPDFSKDFILTTDASNFALGAVLSQGPNGNDKPICYASRTLTESEQNYSTIEKELLAVVWATKYFRPYLYGRKFKIITDHKPLEWLNNMQEPNSKFLRWKHKLMEYDYTIQYKKGKLNNNADALSRIPVEINVHTSLQGNISQTSQTSNVNTIHSAESDDSDYIRISENPLNDFAEQVIFKIGPQSRNLQKIFNTKRRQIITEPEYSQNVIIRIFRLYLSPSSTTAIHCEDNDSFLKIQDVYRKFFSRGKHFKLVKCTKILIDLISESEQDEEIKKYHEYSNHRGITETLLHLKRTFYFPNMKSKIQKFINLCTTCQEIKYDRRPPKQKFEETPTPKRPLEICHMDIFFTEKTPILTIIDKFSKFAQAYILNTRNSIHLKQAVSLFIMSYDSPQTLVVDSEPSFKSIEFRNFCDVQKINLHVTSIQSSTSNSPVERFHSTLLEILKIVNVNKEYKNKPLEFRLCQAIFTYNNSIHSATKCTPFELFFGRKHGTNLLPTIADVEIHKEDFYNEINPKIYDHKMKNLNRANKDREDPLDYPSDQPIYMKQPKQNNKMTPKFKKTELKTQNKVTIVDSKNRKLPKQKLRRPKKFQVKPNHADNDIQNQLPSNGNPGSPRQPRNISPQPGTSKNST